MKLFKTNSLITRLIVSAGFLILAASSDVYAQQNIAAKSKEFILTDSAGKMYYAKEFTSNTIWMTVNLQSDIPGSYCYAGTEENCKLYGRLYTWTAAQKGCSLLGEGWRLPTNDEWQQLIIKYGGIKKDSSLDRKKAYSVLIYDGGSGFNASLGGGYSPEEKYGRLEAHGFYWTATEDTSNTAYYTNFAKGSQALYQQDGGEKERAFSVRCVKSIAQKK